MTAGVDRLRARFRASPLLVLLGVAFVLGSLPKFLAYGWETDNFRACGIPLAGAAVVLVGVVELVGGVLLVQGRFVVPSAVLLTVTMVVAIATSGIGHGDVVPSLTVAPLLLVGLLVVLVRAWRVGRGATA